MQCLLFRRPGSNTQGHRHSTAVWQAFYVWPHAVTCAAPANRAVRAAHVWAAAPTPALFPPHSNAGCNAPKGAGITSKSSTTKKTTCKQPYPRSSKSPELSSSTGSRRNVQVPRKLSFDSAPRWVGDGAGGGGSLQTIRVPGPSSSTHPLPTTTLARLFPIFHAAIPQTVPLKMNTAEEDERTWCKNYRGEWEARAEAGAGGGQRTPDQGAYHPASEGFPIPQHAGTAWAPPENTRPGSHPHTFSFPWYQDGLHWEIFLRFQEIPTCSKSTANDTEEMGSTWQNQIRFSKRSDCVVWKPRFWYGSNKHLTWNRC